MPGDVERELQACLPRLYGYAVSLAGDREPARDLVQECAVKALAAGDPPADRGALRAWFFRILRNAWIDGHRRRMRAPFEDAEEADAPDAEFSGGEDRLIHKIAVRQALAQQTAAHREVLALVDMAGFSYAEVAAILDVPVGTVMSRVARGRKALLVSLGDSNIHPFRAVRRSET